MASSIHTDAPTVVEIQGWKSNVNSYTLSMEHVTIDRTTDDIVYNLNCELETPLPEAYTSIYQHVTLSWPVGGIWKIQKIDESRTQVKCVTRKKTDMTSEQVDAMANEIAEREFAGVHTEIFSWGMQKGIFKKEIRWFLYKLEPMEVGSSSDKSNSSPLPSPLTMELFAGFQPATLSLTINNILSVDFVQQTFNADVKWHFGLSAVTIVREEAVLEEMLDVLKVKEEAFEFSTIVSRIAEDVVDSYVVHNGKIKYQEETTGEEKSEHVYELHSTGRVVATFNEEMSLYYFPFDQQKLTLPMDVTKGVGPLISVTPYLKSAAKFTYRNFKLNNVFHVTYGDRVFVGDVHNDPDYKGVRFEMILERRNQFYLTNVALPAAVITYLSFTSYSDSEEGIIPMEDRLQIVLTLLLTAVTFKYQVAEQLPQVSYFTALDRYVYFCFLITCVACIQNTLIDDLPSILTSEDSDNKYGLALLTATAFTLVNIVWILYLVILMHLRKKRNRVFLMTHEYVQTILTMSVAPQARRHLLMNFLESKGFTEYMMPEVGTDDFGFLHVKLRGDKKASETVKEKFEARADKRRQHIRKKAQEIENFYENQWSEAATTNSHTQDDDDDDAENNMGDGQRYDLAKSAFVTAAVSVKLRQRH